MSLLQPYTFARGATASNRVWLAPLTNTQSHADGGLSEDEARWLERRAAGGFGVVETCAAWVDAGGRSWPGQLGVGPTADLPALRGLTGRLHAHGALAISQLFHGGVRSPSAISGSQPVSASVFHEESKGFEVPRAATDAEVEGFVASFAAAAARCAEAGFDGVELHGAHGYLLGQFLSRTMNTRADRWGGDAAGRATLLREALRAARAAVPQGFLVGVRISPEDIFSAKGLDLDESLQLAAWLEADGADFLHLSLWNAAANTTKRPDAHAIPLFRDAVRLPLVVAGGVWTADDAAAVLDRGADFVALGRAAICNPDWPQRVGAADWQPRRPPLTPTELRSLDVSDTFVRYLSNMRGLVAAEP
jgi:2,4-dienoyl-CoA reductase-like NADH-dependent reductase (Old Yellow Enzyme family)